VGVDRQRGAHVGVPEDPNASRRYEALAAKFEAARRRSNTG